MPQPFPADSDINELARKELALIERSLKVDPYTPAFIFGHTEAYRKARHKRLGPNGRCGSLLRYMLRQGLSPERRASLFPNEFDLGCPRPLPESQRTLTALAKLTRSERRRRDRTYVDDPRTRKKEFDGISDAVRRMTSRKFSDYPNKENTLRVFRLLSRLMSDPSDSSYGRSGRILTLIRNPKDRYSFEFRSSYPTRDSASITHSIDDLQAYLSIEVQSEWVDHAETVFSSLVDRCEHLRFRMDNFAMQRGDPTDALARYRYLHQRLRTFNVPRVSRGPNRLDMDLLLHLHRLEFQHFAGEYKHVLELSVPTSPITPIPQQMLSFLSILIKREARYSDTAADYFHLHDFCRFATSYATDVLDLIETALGFRPSERVYRSIVVKSHELLRRVKAFSPRRPETEEMATVSFRNMISSLCAVAQEAKHRTAYRPLLHGDDGQLRTIYTSLNKRAALWQQSTEEMPEGLFQIWHHRRERVQDILEGFADISSHKFALRQLLFDKVLSCTVAGDIQAITSAIDQLELHLGG